ncbi:hypothetical protein AB4156_40865, partial [Cupriavidus sp. 2MCAB6]|uniref:hypothetical protein n=1 Tax=Cupriavidus sp. 2MCAB6 TaxID=3232981 RepID=UPI003F8E5725
MVIVAPETTKVADNAEINLLIVLGPELARLAGWRGFRAPEGGSGPTEHQPGVEAGLGDHEAGGKPNGDCRSRNDEGRRQRRDQPLD